ncbi:MAG: PAS domain S-box protein, partial [Limisphaerales bacterium]
MNPSNHARLPGRRHQGCARGDALVITILCVAVLVVAHQLDVFERVSAWVLAYRKTGIDEVITTLVFLAFALIVFSFRRRRELEAEIAERERAEEALRVLHGELETRVQQRTTELVAANAALNEEISGRQKAGEALRESEEMHRSLFENMMNGSAYCRMLFEQGRPQDFIYLSVNRAFEAQTGLKNVVGRKVSEVIPGIREADPELFEIYGRVALTGVPERFEMHVAAMQMWFAIAVYSPKKEHFVAVFDAITERKRAEESLAESRRALSAIFDAAADGILLAEIETKKFVTANASICRMLGYRQEELLKLGVADIHPPEALPEAVRRFEQLAAGELGLVTDLPVKRKDGSVFPADVNCTMVTLAGKTCLLGIFRDITARKKTEQDLRLQGAALAAAANEVVITDRAGIIQWVNPAFTKSTGYTPEEAVGHNSGELVKSGRHDTTFYQNLWCTILRGEVWHGELVNRKKDQSLFTEESTITPVKDERGEITHFIAIKQDITEKKLLEAKFLRSQRMESLGSLAGGIAHDLNNALA